MPVHIFGGNFHRFFSQRNRFLKRPKNITAKTMYLDGNVFLRGEGVFRNNSETQKEIPGISPFLNNCLLLNENYFELAPPSPSRHLSRLRFGNIKCLKA